MEHALEEGDIIETVLEYQNNRVATGIVNGVEITLTLKDYDGMYNLCAKGNVDQECCNTFENKGRALREFKHLVRKHNLKKGN